MGGKRKIKFDKDVKPILKGKKIKELPPKLFTLMDQLKKDMNKKADGGTIDMSRGQAGYNFKGVF